MVDPDLQVASEEGETSSRHRVVNNLPGSRAFCPLVRWTPELRAHTGRRWDERARELIGRTHRDVASRTAAFLLLSDSRSSFQIEGERPAQDRVERWGRAIGAAGRRALDFPVGGASADRIRRHPLREAGIT